MMDVYDVRDDTLLDLARQAAKKGWWHVYHQRRGYVDWETEAQEALDLQLLYVPGLLQTEDYMRALFTNSRYRRTPSQLQNDIAARLFRQRRLVDREAPLTLVAIIDESALRWPVGGAAIMRDQLWQLVERAQLDTVTVHVLPRSPRPHDGMNGAFTVLRFPDEEDPDLLFVDYPVGAIHVEDAKGVEEVKAARLLFGELRSEALSPLDSMEFIADVAREL